MDLGIYNISHCVGIFIYLKLKMLKIKEKHVHAKIFQ